LLPRLVAKTCCQGLIAKTWFAAIHFGSNPGNALFP
jgi:hypothetical protein